MLEKFGQVSRIGGLILILLSALVGGAAASAQSPNTLVSFAWSSSNPDGAKPYAGLLADAHGDLFGTTYSGGANNSGTVFEIVNTGTPNTPVYASTANILHSFSGGSDGAHPYAGLIDANDNLFGTTETGGAGYGTVFEIVRSQCTSTSCPITPLYSFTGGTSDGANPQFGSLITDANGNLYGTTKSGGASNLGTVFELSPASSSSTGYAESILASFDGSDGAGPYGGLIMDGVGNLLGTTSTGGPSYDSNDPLDYPGEGTVFEIVMSQCTSSGCQVTPLASFNGTDGLNPEAGLIADAKGNLFGTTYEGGPSYDGVTSFGDGTVFEIVNSGTVAAPSYASTPTTLVSFNSSNGSDGKFVHASLIIDAADNLWGTTRQGGANGYGTVFEVKTDSMSATGYASTLNTFSFSGSNGSDPYAGLIADGNGNLFGTTRFGGSSSLGTAFELTGSGFVTTTQNPFVGTPGTPSCVGDTISNLTHTYGGIAHAASSLEYSSVKDLQSAVAQYCSQ